MRNGRFVVERVLAANLQIGPRQTVPGAVVSEPGLRSPGSG
ncbi:hypothetical protein [Frigoribacterium sp. MEB024]|nr:hypothetical protein [Frigoribacterium sp. MEB024]